VVEAGPTELKSAEPLKRIIPPGTVIDPTPDRLPELAIARDVDPELSLAAHDAAHRGAQRLLKFPRVDRLARVAGPVGLDQVVGARQAPGMAG